MGNSALNLQKWIAGIVASVSVATAIGALGGFVADLTRTKQQTAHMAGEILDLRTDLDLIEHEIDELARGWEPISAEIEAATEDGLALEAAQLRMELRRLSTEVESLKAALGSDLERSLSVPLLRKDLIQLNAQVDERTAAAAKDIDRIYDQNKWFLGLMGTMSVGLLGLAVSNFIQARKGGS